MSRTRLAAHQDACPEALQQLLSDFATYERDLELLGVRDAQLVDGLAAPPRGPPVVWSALEVLVALPFAVVGALVHVVPFQIMKQVGKRPTNEGIKATVKLLGCFVLFAATYAVLGVLVGRVDGAWAGLGAALAAPLCGFLTVRVLERVRAVRRRGRGVPDHARRTATCSDRCWRTAPRSCGTRARSCASREAGHRQVPLLPGPASGLARRACEPALVQGPRATSSLRGGIVRGGPCRGPDRRGFAQVMGRCDSHG